MSNKVWVYIDHFKGELLPASLETITAGQKLAEKLNSKLTALVFGHGIENLAKQVIQHGVDELLAGDSDGLGAYQPEPYTSLISGLAKDMQPEVILFPATSSGRELAAMTAIDLESGVITDAVGLEIEDGWVTVMRPAYGGKVLAKVQCKIKPQIIVLRSHIFAPSQPDSSRSGAITNIKVDLGDESQLSKLLEYIPSGGGVSLSDANVIVSGGRGVSNNANLVAPAGLDDKDAEIWRAQQGFNLLTELANTLNGAVGASRAAVDAGFISYEHQVGQTGKIVSPNLYIACGLSGSIQHLAGVRTSKLIIAINNDPDSPILTFSKYGVVGDLFEIVPALTEAFRKHLAM